MQEEVTAGKEKTWEYSLQAELIYFLIYNFPFLLQIATFQIRMYY